MKFRFCKLKQVEFIFLMIKCTISIYEKFGKLCYDFMCVNDINPQPLFFRILTLVYIVPSPFPFMQCRLQTQIFGSVSQKKGKKKKRKIFGSRLLLIIFFLHILECNYESKYLFFLDCNYETIHCNFQSYVLHQCKCCIFFLIIK